MNQTTITRALRHPVALLAAAVALLAPAGAAAQQDAAKIGEGAQVYAANCVRCHNARSGTERSDLEWIPIVQHMRARANLSRRQADAVLAFLQATNMPEPGGAAQATAASTPPAGADEGAGPSRPRSVLPAALRAALLPEWARAFSERLERLGDGQDGGGG